MAWETLTTDLKCPKCGKVGLFEYKEPDSPFMGGGISSAQVSDGFKFTKETGYGHSTEISCEKCGLRVH